MTLHKRTKLGKSTSSFKQLILNNKVIPWNARKRSHQNLTNHDLIFIRGRITQNEQGTMVLPRIFTKVGWTAHANEGYALQTTNVQGLIPCMQPHLKNKTVTTKASPLLKTAENTGRELRSTLLCPQELVNKYPRGLYNYLPKMCCGQPLKLVRLTPEIRCKNSTFSVRRSQGNMSRRRLGSQKACRLSEIASGLYRQTCK